MLSLLQCIAVESLGNLRIALAVSLTSHSNVHTDLATLTIIVVAQLLNHLFRNALNLTITKTVNCSVGYVASLFLQFREL